MIYVERGSMDKYKNSLEAVNLLENDKYTFSVLRSILTKKCEFILTDHKHYIICYSYKPFPIWIWTRDDITKEQAEKVYTILKNNSLLNGQYRFNLKYDFSKFLIDRAKIDGIEISISLNLLTYECLTPIKPSKKAKGKLHKCTEEDVFELADLIGCFHDEVEIDKKNKGEHLTDARLLINEGNVYFWKDDASNNVACCRYTPRDGELACIGLVFTRTENRRKNYAQNLVYSVTNIARNEGFIPILYTNANYAASNECYTKIGYEVKGRLCMVKCQVL